MVRISITLQLDQSDNVKSRPHPVDQMPPGTFVDVTMVDALLHGPCGEIGRSQSRRSLVVDTGYLRTM